MTLRVANWREHFENNRTRELKVMTWVPVPTKQDGDGYTQIMDHPQGAAHYGTWIAILQVAAKCEERGTLLREGRNGVRVPHDAASISRLTRIPRRTVSDAIGRLIEIGWLAEDGDQAELTSLKSIAPHDAASIPQESATRSREGAPSRARAVGQDIEEKGRVEHCPPTPPPGGGATEPHLPAYLAALASLHPRFCDEHAVARALFEQRSQLPPLEEFRSTLSAWASSSTWREEGGRFAPKPARWLRDGGYKSRPTPADQAPDRYRGSGKRPSHEPTAATKAALARLSGKESAA